MWTSFVVSGSFFNTTTLTILLFVDVIDGFLEALPILDWLLVPLNICPLSCLPNAFSLNFWILSNFNWFRFADVKLLLLLLGLSSPSFLSLKIHAVSVINLHLPCLFIHKFIYSLFGTIFIFIWVRRNVEWRVLTFIQLIQPDHFWIFSFIVRHAIRLLKIYSGFRLLVMGWFLFLCLIYFLILDCWHLVRRGKVRKLLFSLEWFVCFVWNNFFMFYNAYLRYFFFRLLLNLINLLFFFILIFFVLWTLFTFTLLSLCSILSSFYRKIVSVSVYYINKIILII